MSILDEREGEWLKDDYGWYCRIGVFGVAIGPINTGSYGRAYLFFWLGAGRSGQRHWFADYPNHEEAMTRAVPDALAVLARESSCSCSYLEACSRHAKKAA